MGYKGLPVVELKRKNKNSKISAIAMVDRPAIESDFHMFQSDEEHKYVFVSEPEKMIAGLALIPNKYIYRTRMEDGIEMEYFVFFSKETVKELRNDFMKNKRNDAINFMHVENAIPEDTYLVETFIVESKYQQADLKERFGIIDAPIGSLFVQMHVESLELFNQIKEFGFKGFSIEGYFDEELVSLNKLELKNNNIMNKIIEKFKAVIAEFEAEDKKKFETAKIAETGQEVVMDGVGKDVKVVGVDATGAATETPMPDGIYVLEDGREITVSNGMLEAITEPKPEEEMVEKEEEMPVEEKPEEEMPVEEKPEEEMPVEEKPEEEMIDECVAALMAEGMSAEEAILKCAEKEKEEMAAQAQKFAEMETMVATQLSKIAELEAEITTLKSQLKLPVAQPIVNPKKNQLKADLDKMTPYERTALSKGFRIIN